MDRRRFFASGSAANGAGASAVAAQENSDYSKDGRPDAHEGTCTAGSLDGGGGLHPEGATLIHATADSEELRIRMSKLDGSPLEEVTLKG